MRVKDVSTQAKLLTLVIILIMFLVSSCAVVQSESITKIALLAPFEGRYRDIGYNALYAVRLAIKDSGLPNVHLLAVDDGGTVESSQDRMKALNIDPAVTAIIGLGQYSSHPDVQNLAQKPFIIVGYWGHENDNDTILMAVNQDIGSQVTSNLDITQLDSEEPISGSDLLILKQVPDLYDDLANIEIVSSGQLPDTTFREQFINSDLYVPDPNLLATLTYDIGNLILDAIESDTSLVDMEYNGINGTIRFSNGYWKDAPIHRYRYENDQLVELTN